MHKEKKISVLSYLLYHITKMDVTETELEGMD